MGQWHHIHAEYLTVNLNVIFNETFFKKPSPLKSLKKLFSVPILYQKLDR